jgi:hypothetical protein
MAVQFGWDNEQKTIFCYTYQTGWTWEDFFAARKQAYVLMDAVSHKFGLILDASHVTRLPPNTLANARNSLRTSHRNVIIIVMVVTHPFVRALVNTLQDVALIAPLSIEMAVSMDEARTIISEHLCVRQLDDPR